MKRPNILFYFSDQQRYDTLGCNNPDLKITPNVDQLAKEGVNFQYAYTTQPVCGPARSILQTGLYATQTGCFRNGISLPITDKTLAKRLREAGYKVAYVGKWHLASEDGLHYETTAVPEKRRGGYNDYWVASDVLEFTSHGYGGHLYDHKGFKRSFDGYRTDCVTDFALDYLNERSPEEDSPFFLFLSHMEPHHQNDHHQFEGPKGSADQFKNYPKPGDLDRGKGDWESQMPDYLGCCHALDDNLGRVVKKLKERGLYEDTIIIYTSDHGCHFQTHLDDIVTGGFDDYKRNCYESVIHIPLIISGRDFSGGLQINHIVELIDLPRTIIKIAGGDSNGMQGVDLLANLESSVNPERDAYVQISESYLGRALRTKRWTYCIYAPEKNPNKEMFSDTYRERFLFDNEKDP